MENHEPHETTDDRDVSHIHAYTLSKTADSFTIFYIVNVTHAYIYFLRCSVIDKVKMPE